MCWPARRRGGSNQCVNADCLTALQSEYFVQQGLEWEIRDDLRRRVDFREMNLVKDWPVLPSFDIIFLRNVLIYFDVETKRTVFARDSPLALRWLPVAGRRGNHAERG